MTTLTAEKPTLTPNNARLNDGLLNAMAALHWLNDHGLRVRSISASPMHGPVIVLDEAPKPSVLEGALKARICTGLVAHVTRVATVLGCQVEWRCKQMPGAIAGTTVEVAA
jgi:hypothetical protein